MKYIPRGSHIFLTHTDDASYFMSDFERGMGSGARIQLDGKDGAEVNVNKIHNNQVTAAGNTPFDSVRKAYMDLAETSADEKWLVILTDGEFQGVDGTSGIDDYLGNKNSDINVMFLGMGSNAMGITEKQSENIYYVEAKTNDQILGKITEICTRIFNSNKLEVNVSTKKFSFDVPMGELIVFAQGANVSIEGIIGSNGKEYKTSKIPVEVRYSENAATNYPNPLIDRNLAGCVATFKDDFPNGEYTVNVSGAETIEIYYKPNIEVAIFLTDKDGNEVTDLSSIEAGQYTVSFGFVKAGTNERVVNSKLLGNVLYSAEVSNNGNTLGNEITSGDIINVEEGVLNVSVEARYLEYNSVSTDLEYMIYKDKEITFSICDNPQYEVLSDGFNNNNPILIEAKIDGDDFTQDQWDKMEMPKIELVGSHDFKIAISAEKTDQIGIIKIQPILPNGRPSTGTYKDCDYIIEYEQHFDKEKWKGSSQGVIGITDTRSWWERNWDLFVKLLIFAIILIILAGYLPLFKHYLPKSLKSKPYIKCIPSEPGEKRKDRSGVVIKNFLSTIIPYIPQTGTIKYVPKGVTGSPPLSVKGIKNRRMTITNIKAFAGKDNITFDGESIKADCKKFDTGGGVCIKVKKGEWTYVCTPNQESK